MIQITKLGNRKLKLNIEINHLIFNGVTYYFSKYSKNCSLSISSCIKRQKSLNSILPADYS